MFDPALSIDTQQEVAQAQALATAAERASCPLAVVTSDAVFSGPRMFHCEISPTSANHAAAEAVKTLERSLSQSTALIVRAHTYGWSPIGAEAGFAESVWTNLTTGQGCPVDAQNYATPILAGDLGKLLVKALELNLRGIYHLTGAERASQYRFAAEMAVTFGLTGRQVLLEPPKRKANRPFMDETSLNTAAARRDLRMPLPMLREGLALRRAMRERLPRGTANCMAPGNAASARRVKRQFLVLQFVLRQAHGRPSVGFYVDTRGISNSSYSRGSASESITSAAPVKSCVRLCPPGTATAIAPELTAARQPF